MYAALAIVSVLAASAGICAAQPVDDPAPPPRFAGDPLLRAPDTDTWEVGSSLDLERRSTARLGSAAAPASGSYDRTTLTLSAAHRLGFGLVELQLPISTIRFRDPGTATDVSGVGDASLHFHRYRHGARWSTGYFLGVRLPTGATAAMPVVGDQLPTVVQLGGGTVDPEFGACTELALGGATALGFCDHGRIALYANRHGYREGYEFQARVLATSAFADGRVSAHAGVMYETRSAAELDGDDLPASGHHELFAEASVWFVVVRGLSVRSTVELPVYRRVTGMQLADTVRVMAGLSYDFAR
jgi:hypothetical protein